MCSGDDGWWWWWWWCDDDGDGEEKEDGEEGVCEGVCVCVWGWRDVVCGCVGGVWIGCDVGVGGEENECDDDDGNDDGGEWRSEMWECVFVGVVDGECEECVIVVWGVCVVRWERGMDELYLFVGGVDERWMDVMWWWMGEFEWWGWDEWCVWMIDCVYDWICEGWVIEDGGTGVGERGVRRG